MLTQERLKELFHYDPKTGIFTCTENNKKKYKLGPIGSRERYIRIFIDDERHPAHRCAWLYVYGKLPDQYIDHIDGNKYNNAISNLRDVSIRENSCNQEMHRNGRLPGTSYVKECNKWRAYYSVKKKKTHLGCFETEKEAHEAYLNAIKNL